MLGTSVLCSIWLSACYEEDGDKTAYGNGGAVAERFRPVAKAMQDARVAQGVPGAALAIVEGGKVTFARGFGSKNAGAENDVSPSSLFQIASCTKMMTATAVLGEVDRGKLDIERPVIDYLPVLHFNTEGYPVNTITVRHLLTHSSGIADHLAESNAASDQADGALQQYVAGQFADDSYVMSPSGAFYNYSNPNYMLLGRLAEQSSGQHYRELVTERIFQPLGMKRTYLTAAEVEADGDYARGGGCDVANPYCPDTDDGATVASDYQDNAWFRPVGGVWTSVLDMAKFARFLLYGDANVLRAETWDAMTSAQVNQQGIGELESYGFGVEVTQGLPFLSEYYDVEMIGHSGSNYGYTSAVRCIKDLDFCVIALASGDKVDLSQPLATAFETLANLPAPSEPPVLATNPERYAEYAGKYVDAFAFGTIDISTKEGKLLIAIERFPSELSPYSAELIPMHSDTFALAYEGGYEELSFIADGTGTYKYLRTRDAVGVRSE